MLTGRFLQIIKVVILPLLIVSCVKENGKQDEVGRDVLNDQAQIFGADRISTALPEFATSFSPDGDTVYFNVALADRSAMQIKFATRANGEWGAPKSLPFSDGTFMDVDPFVSHDGSRLHFSSNRPLSGGTPKDFDTWYVEKRDDGWSTPINPGAPLNGVESEVFFSMAKDGTAYFSVSTDGIRKIYRANFKDGAYEAPAQISLGLADSISVGNPLIDPQERFILFVSSEIEGASQADIYIADRQEAGSFSNVRNLGPQVNSTYTEFAPGLSPDGKYLYFTSERPGIVGAMEEGRPPGDLYSVSLESVFSSLSGQ